MTTEPRVVETLEIAEQHEQWNIEHMSVANRDWHEGKACAFRTCITVIREAMEKEGADE